EAAFPALATAGLLITRDRVAPLASSDAAIEWITTLRKKGLISVPAKERDEFLGALLCSPGLPPLRVPEEMRYQEVALPPRTHLKISKPRVHYWNERLDGELFFAYEDRMFAAFDAARGYFDTAGRRFVHRDADAEKAACALLEQLGVKRRAQSYPD